MGKISKAFAFSFIVLLFISIVALQPHFAEAQSNSQNSPPEIAWQHVYGNSNIEYSSNLVQTNDNGFIFMDTGWNYQETLKPATIYKLDSSGNTQWTKIIDSFVGDAIIQTSDGGYEITGEWSAFTPTMIKTDSNGNIQWVQNYSRVPSLGISGIMQFWEGYNATPYQTTVQTSDGGFVFWSLGQITKTDSTNRTQWVENFTYISPDAPPPKGVTGLPIFWLIETSDGGVAFLGVGTQLEDVRFSGNIYLYKTDPFLPEPSPTQLPTPIPTPTPTPSQIGSLTLNLAIPIIAIVIIAVVFISALLFRRHRKTSNLNKGSG